MRALSEPMVFVSERGGTGKAFLVLTALNESGCPHVYVDLREGFTSYSALTGSEMGVLCGILRTPGSPPVRRGVRGG